ncbi:MAG: hypothetical protein U1E65_24610 [Myxococcota bacterium]
MARIHALIAGATALSAFACGEPFSNDDLVFLKSLPTKDVVNLRLPEDDAASALHEAEDPPMTAIYYAAAKNVSKGINGGIQDTLDLVEKIRVYPPTIRRDDFRAWGPIDGGAIEYALFVTKTSTPAMRVPTSSTTLVPAHDVFTFSFGARMKGETDFAGVIAGEFAPIDGADRGIGWLFFDYERLHQLDPAANPSRGRSWVGYDTRSGVSLMMSFELPPDMPGAMAQLGGYYRYTRTPEGVVDFLFAYKHDLSVGENQPPISALETFYVFARWNKDHRGRADLVVMDGDLMQPIGGSECWDDRFFRVYFQASIPELGAPYGDVSACAPGLEMPLYPR